MKKDRDSITTTDLGEFGFREIKMVRDLLDAWVDQGLPNDFDQDGVKPCMNKHSGNVFLTNDNFDVAMMNGDKLESFYSTPYEGREGFFDDLKDEFEQMHREDQKYMRDLAEILGREDELPSEDEEDEEEEESNSEDSSDDSDDSNNNSNGDPIS